MKSMKLRMPIAACMALTATAVLAASPQERLLEAGEMTVPRAYTNAAGKVFRYRWAEPLKVQPG
ncbi:MAG: hypothetical protein ACI4Q3_01460, partial [Kiritimatiellia bacterium]